MYRLEADEVVLLEELLLAIVNSFNVFRLIIEVVRVNVIRVDGVVLFVLA